MSSLAIARFGAGCENTRCRVFRDGFRARTGVTPERAETASPSRHLLLAWNPQVAQELSLPLLCFVLTRAHSSGSSATAFLVTVEPGLCRKIDQRLPTRISIALGLLALIRANDVQDFDQTVFVPTVFLFETLRAHRLEFGLLEALASLVRMRRRDEERCNANER